MTAVGSTNGCVSLRPIAYKIKKSIQDVTRCRDSRSANSRETG